MDKMLRKLVAFVAAGLLWWSGPACATSSILIVSSSPVTPGKFRLLEELARPQGFTLDVRYVEKLPSDVDGKLFAGHQLVLLDTPRDHIRDAVRARLARAWPELRIPAVWLHTTAPAQQGLSEPLLHRLHAYYINGSSKNFENFFRTLAAYFKGQPWESLPEPIVFPRTAIYHPQAPQIVFPDTAAYFAWKGVDSEKRPPVVAIAFHQQTISSEQTLFVDDLIRRIEAAGAIALPFYAPVMGKTVLQEVLAPGGRLMADVLINTQIMLNPEGRRAEFEAMGIPVIQGMTYRKGDEAAWEKDPQGVALMDVPFYLAQSEYTGVTDIQIAAAQDEVADQPRAIEAQAASVVNKALNMVKLQRKAKADKKVTMFFWNYPAGEKNLSASYLNLLNSFDVTLKALREQGYTTTVPSELVLKLQLQRLLAPFYQPANDQRELESLVRDGLAGLVPLEEYKQWLNSLPNSVREGLQARWGGPEKSSMLVAVRGRQHFVVPRLKLGNVVLMPQPGRGERWEEAEKSLYHSTSAVPSHAYMATYYWVRKGFDTDAIIHFGTHGSQEWLPGKERGLSMFDYPHLMVGDVPVVYPYIVDNIGESTQAKRRGRAVIISHQTPPFAPAGLHDALTHIHDQIHVWMNQDEGSVRDKLRAEILAAVRKERIDKDLGWDEARIRQDFPGLVNVLHDHLHELALTAQPMGMHTFGRGAEQTYRIATVLMMLGKPYWEDVAQPGEEADEMLIGDYRKLAESRPYSILQRFLTDGVVPKDIGATAAGLLPQARDWYDMLGARGEINGLLAALDGRYIPTSYGGDPMKNPDALPTGRNMYGFDPSRVPTKAAWEAGKEAFNGLLALHRQKTGKFPQKLTFTLWSVETMRHFGMLEAQAFWALGVQPVWDAGGRVVDVKLIPAAELKRPRVDIVLSATGLYRDHFPNVMKWLAHAVQLAAEARNEADNPVARNASRIEADLIKRGWDPVAARRAGQTRIFSSESGNYGTGLDDAALATDTWKGKAEGDRKLAQLYLSKMQYAYGPDESEWGSSGAVLGGRGGKDINLYAEHLRGTEGGVLARTSNLYGMLTTDDPFQFLGGIALAVRHLDGKAPELYISNLRGNGGGKAEGAAEFLSKELATRNFHPGYIQGLMREGYAGTVKMLDSLNNFAGWTSVAREVVRDDQWQEFMDVYVRDKHKLGLNEYFERHNPHALAQQIERMLEAVRQGYWQADKAVVEELKQRYTDLARRHDVKTDNKSLQQFVGYGLLAALPIPAAGEGSPPAEPVPPPPPLEGIKLEKVEKARPDQMPVPLAALGMGLVFLATLGGALRPGRA